VALPERLDDEVCYRALAARDRRFDGWFFVGVTSTGIYCRPSCPSVMPKRRNVRFFPSSAGAQRAGFRACKRCRPDTSPGSPEWNRRGDVVGRAMRSIADGVVDREGVTGLAGRLGYSCRQLQRLLVGEVGAGPRDLARARRCETARILLETTTLRLAEVAFAAGFNSVRQFNDTMRAAYGEAPSAMRARAGRHAGHRPGGPAGVTLRLAYRAPFDAETLFSFLAARAAPGLEQGDATWYRRSLSLPHGGGVATVRAPGGAEPSLSCELLLDDLRDLTAAVERMRRLLDLDADPDAVADVLGSDPLLGPSVRARPGVRIPGHVDGVELAVRAVLGQQVSVAGARNLAARLAGEHGESLPTPVGSVVRRFPSAATLAALSPSQLPMPLARARALVGLCELVADGGLTLDGSADREEVSARLLALPGIGPWTVSYVRMRALCDPDAFLPGDLGVRRALERLGVPPGERAATELAERWRPYRAYALQYLWSGVTAKQVAAPATKEAIPA